MTGSVREYHYRVDRDGRVFHDGTEIVDPAVLRFFLRAMTRTDHFVGDYREPLDPRTLEAERDLLFCRVRGGLFRARFGRVALQQLAPFLLDTGEGLALLVSGARHPVRATAAVI